MTTPVLYSADNQDPKNGKKKHHWVLIALGVVAVLIAAGAISNAAKGGADRTTAAAAQAAATTQPSTTTSRGDPTTSPTTTALTTPRTTPTTPRTTPTPTLDVHVSNPAANASVDAMYSDLDYVVLLYVAAGDGVSAAEAGVLADAMDDVTAATGVATAFIDAGAFSPAQMAAMLDMANAGSDVCDDIGAMSSNYRVQSDFDDYERAYRQYQAAS